MKCSSVKKNLSAFLDNELSQKEHRQIETHISECVDCHHELEKLRGVIGLISNTEYPGAPAQLWEETRRKLETVSDQPIRTRIFRMPIWAAIPAGAGIFVILLYTISSQLFFTKYEADPIPITVYLEEHALSYSEQILSSDLLSELTIVQTEQFTDNTQSDAQMSELDMLMEVHYGTDPTNGS